MNKLHRASCSIFSSRATPNSATWCWYSPDLKEMVEWLDEIGEVYQPCRRCLFYLPTEVQKKVEKMVRELREGKRRGGTVENSPLPKGDFSKGEVKRGGENMVGKVADFLIKVYREEKVPWSKGFFQMRGFDAKTLEKKEKFFEFMVCISFDQRPFNMKEAWDGVRMDLEERGIFNLEEIRTLTPEQIRKRMGRYAEEQGKRFFQAVHYIVKNLDSIFKMITEISDCKEITSVWFKLQEIPTIGPTISAKILMYCLREIGLVKLEPLQVEEVILYQLLKEYHNQKCLNYLRGRTGEPQMERKLMEALNQKGEPFAIDALFWIDLRNKYRELEEVINT